VSSNDIVNINVIVGSWIFDFGKKLFCLQISFSQLGKPLTQHCQSTMFFDNKPYTFDRIVRISITAGLLLGLVWFLLYLADVLIPFAAALLLAYYRRFLVSAKARDSTPPGQ
jgi:hypothetical protein